MFSAVGAVVCKEMTMLQTADLADIDERHTAAEAVYFFDEGYRPATLTAHMDGLRVIVGYHIGIS
jgi:hypothetical protein